MRRETLLLGIDPKLHLPSILCSSQTLCVHVCTCIQCFPIHHLVLWGMKCPFQVNPYSFVFCLDSWVSYHQSKFHSGSTMAYLNMTLDNMLCSWWPWGGGWGTLVAYFVTTLVPHEPYLSNIDGRVQTWANIHDNVCAEVLVGGNIEAVWEEMNIWNAIDMSGWHLDCKSQSKQRFLQAESLEQARVLEFSPSLDYHCHCWRLRS
jgi:hypothetical protein